MLDKILFWVVLVWMVGMLVMAIVAVREVWKDAGKPQPDENEPAAPAGDSPSSADGGDPKPNP
jgi:hypothetical protein